MSINCLIVDDEPLARELLRTYIERLPQLRLAGECENALQASVLLKQEAIDLMFLDIEMPLLKGTDFLKDLSRRPAVIITTAYREYALAGYELDIVDYLLKPIVFERFFKAVEKFSRQRAQMPLPAGNADAIFLQHGGRHFRLLPGEVLFVESAKDYITIHRDGTPSLVVKQNISAFQQLLDERFLRVHRSFIINTQQISAFSRSEVWIGETAIPIGERFMENWKAFSERILQGR